MNTDDPKPLSEQARRLLDAERRRPDAGEDVASRVREHMLTSIAASTIGATAVGGAGATAATAALPANLRAKIGAALATAFLAGGGTGVVTYRAVAPRPPSAEVQASAPQECATRLTTSAPDAPPAALSATLPSASATATDHGPAAVENAPAPARSEGKDADLARERILLERARMAMARGEPSEAIDALGTHAREYPAGRMIEEREALLVQALAQAGRMQEARGRADRFRARFPHSVFVPVIDALLAPIQRDE
jgi:hypothetical protein